MNQRCDCYGKLLCNACMVEVPQFGTRARQEIVGQKMNWDDIFDFVFSFLVPVSLYIAVGLLILWWLLGWVFSAAALVFGVIALVVFAQFNTKPIYKTVVDEDVEVGRSKCCIACRQPAEHLA